MVGLNSNYELTSPLEHKESWSFHLDIDIPRNLVRQIFVY
jgi:hypothetical protein